MAGSSFDTSVSNCLVCQQSVIVTSSCEESREPKLSDLEEIKRALLIFSRLLGGKADFANLGENGDKLFPECNHDWNGYVGSFESPCCSECSEALLSVLRLQRVISEAQRSLKDKVQALKASLFNKSINEGSTTSLANGCGYHSSWLQIRQCLETCCMDDHAVKHENFIGTQTTAGSRRSRTRRKLGLKSKRRIKFNGQTAQAAELNRCTVVLERLQNCDLLMKNSNGESQSLSVSNSPISTSKNLPRRKRTKKGGVALLQNVSGDEEEQKLQLSLFRDLRKEVLVEDEMMLSSVDNEDEKKFSKRAKTMDDSDREGGNISDAVDDADFQDKKSKPKRKRTARVRGKSSSGVKQRRACEAHMTLFVYLRPDLFLFNYTTIKRVGAQFVCEEDDCGVVLQGINALDSGVLDDLKSHIMENHAGGPFASKSRNCPLCNEACPSGRHLRSHISHVHSSPRLCEVCWRPMATQMKSHVWHHKNSDEKKAAIAAGELDRDLYRLKYKDSIQGSFPCGECGKTCKTQTLLRCHQRMHAPNRTRVQCAECGAMLLSEHNLKLHTERVHNSVEKASRSKLCPICDRRFSIYDTTKFDAHVRGHRNEKPFVCEICGKGFCAKISLLRHGNVHSNARPFQCEFCSESYKHPRNLVRHQKAQHADQLPLVAPDMALKYTMKGESLSDFIGPRIAFPCEFCDKVFQLRSRMTKHVKTSHANNMVILGF